MHVMVAGNLVAGDRLDEATIECQTALQLDPSSAKAYYILGEIGALQGKYQRAVDNWERAVEIAPNRHPDRCTDNGSHDPDGDGPAELCSSGMVERRELRHGQ